jgi:hypothetical protein
MGAFPFIQMGFVIYRTGTFLTTCDFAGVAKRSTAWLDRFASLAKSRTEI